MILKMKTQIEGHVNILLKLKNPNSRKDYEHSRSNMLAIKNK